jgi:hypothetical protein
MHDHSAEYHAYKQSDECDGEFSLGHMCDKHGKLLAKSAPSRGELGKTEVERVEDNRSLVPGGMGLVAVSPVFSRAWGSSGKSFPWGRAVGEEKSAGRGPLKT